MKNKTIHEDKKLKILNELKEYFDYSAKSKIRNDWLTRYQECLDFYDGNQWSDELKHEMAEVGANPFVVNRIEPIVTTYVSLQIASRRRIAFKPLSKILKHKELSEYLNNMLYVIQAQNNFQNKSTQKYTDALIGGIGWTQFGYEASSNNTFFYEHIDPREVYFDPDDQSERFEDSQFVCRSYFVNCEKLKSFYTEHEVYFDNLLAAKTSAEYKFSADYNYTKHDVWTIGKSARIVDVFYKKKVKYYQTLVKYDVDVNDEAIPSLEYFITFDKDIAENRKFGNEEIVVLEGTQIFKGTFCQDLLLEHGPIDGQVPNQKHFPLIPLCLKRNQDGIPYGVVQGLIPLSTALNWVWTKTMHGLNSKYLVVDPDSVNLDNMRDKIDIELRKPIGIIGSKNPHQVQLMNSETLLPFLERTLSRIDLEFEKRTQLFDELKGEQTNAISGIAIQARASNSARTQNPLHSIYEHMLFSEGQLMLDTIKGISKLEYVFNYYKDDEINTAVINDEISTIGFEIFTDFAPNFVSSKEETTARFEALLNSPNASFVLSDPIFLEKLGFSNSEAKKLHEAFIKVSSGAQNQNNQQEQQQKLSIN
jgi:hypothetical protein